MKLSDFNYYLPKELIAQYPLEVRDESRMMVVERGSGSVRHKRFKDLDFFMRKGDAAVLNDSRVIPARIKCRKETGGKAEIFILTRREGNLCEALLRPAGMKAGAKLLDEGGLLLAEVGEAGEGGGRLVRFTGRVDIRRELQSVGRMPLPPYIKRDPEDSDKERYQTVYACSEGATASPTAGLHFTRRTLESLRKKGVGVSYLTLHVSYGTFAPVRADDVRGHRMHRERFELPVGTAHAVREAKVIGGRALAVGTTSARVMEHCAEGILEAEGRRPKAEGGKNIKGYTELFIYPSYRFKVVDMLLTNFHLPKSTLLLLVSAFAGRELIVEAYRKAVEKRYRFYSYGDCMLIM